MRYCTYNYYNFFLENYTKHDSLKSMSLYSQNIDSLMINF